MQYSNANREFNDDIIEVRILNTDSMGNIWVSGMNSNEIYDRMHADLNEYMNGEDVEDEGFEEDEGSWEKGPKEELTLEEVERARGEVEMCAVLWDITWFRGVIENYQDGNIKVFLIDLGRYIHVEENNLEPLPYEFARVPWRAIKIKLPITYGLERNWPTAAITYIKGVTVGRRAKIHIVERGTEGVLRAEVLLRDWEGEITDDLGYMLLDRVDIWEESPFA